MKSTSSARWRAFVWTALLLILLLAAALRFYGLGILPPGLNHDEAAHEIAARELAQAPRFAPFFPINFGLEAGYIYLIAGLFALAGPFAEGGRVVSAWAGLFNVALSFALAREMLGRSESRRWATVGALAAAAQTAFTYWYIHHSRMGFELMLVPTMSTLAFWALWRAARGDGLWRYGLAGALLGLSIYTYPAARLLPLVPAGQAVLCVVLMRQVQRPGQPRASWWSYWPAAAVYVGGAVLAALPLLIFFAQNPNVFIERAGQVAVLSPGALLDNTLKSLGGIFWRGDSNPRLNLPGRPLLDPLQAALFVIGLAALLRRWRQPASTFIFVWTGMMFLPGILSDYPPHYARLCGVLPPLTLTVTWGGVTLAAWLYRRRRELAWSVLPLAALVTGAWSAYGYFELWPRVPDLLSTFDAGFRRAAEIIRRLPPDAPVYLSPIDRDYLTIRFIVGDERARSIKSYNGRRCVVFPTQSAQPSFHVIVVAEDKRSLPFLQAAFPQLQIIQREKMGSTPYLAVIETPGGTQPAPFWGREYQVTFEGAIRLRGLTVEERAFHPGETIEVELAWEALAAMRRDYTSFVQLVGPYNPARGNPLWGQEDAQPCDNSYPTSWWSPGEWIVEQRRLVIAPGAPAGDYELWAGWYDWETGQRLPTNSGDDHITLTPVHIAP